MTTTRPQVAIFIDDFSATGVVRNAVAIANRLHARGAAVELVATSASGTLRPTLEPGIPVTQLLPAHGDGQSRRTRLRRSFLAYRSYLKRSPPGVLLSAGNQGHLASASASVGIAGLKLVVRISNDLDHHGRSGWRRSLRHLKSRWIAARADRLVFVAQGLADSWMRTGGVHAAKVRVIPNGVDVPAVRSAAAEQCGHPWLAGGAVHPVVLGIGRLSEQKNLATLIRAVGIATRKQPMRLLLIGSGPLHDGLVREAAAAGIGDAFAIIAPVANPMPFMARAAVVALPSWWEGASNVLLEALACGAPVVASRTAGSAAEVLDGGRYGLLVDPADPQALADALQVQLSTRAVLPGARAADFSQEASVDAYADLLLSLAG
jgi:glycosyltransferase involved in cell wall biosynthesis